MSPARQQSFATLDLIAAQGFDICLDWEQDEVPVAMATSTAVVTAVPISNELDDRVLLIDKRQTEDEWADQVLEAASYMVNQGPDRGATVLGFSLTHYVAGQPFRIAALKRLLSGLAANPGVWAATPGEIATQFHRQ